MITEKK